MTRVYKTVSKGELDRISELEDLKEKKSKKFTEERQWELDGLLERKALEDATPEEIVPKPKKKASSKVKAKKKKVAAKKVVKKAKGKKRK